MKAPTVPRRNWRAPSRRRISALRERLRDVYGRPCAPPHGQAIDELILTVLSQSTNDRNRDVAFLRLRERFAGVADGTPLCDGVARRAGPRVDWEAVRDAPRQEVEDAIQPGGLHRQKSARIQEILRALDGDDLSWMAAAPVEEARAALTALPGVGRKTTACVLLFSYGLHDIPVDTHVSRVGTRLGLFRPGAPFEELHDDLLRLVRPGEGMEFHVNLLRHGRRTCHAQRPRCHECHLRRGCPRVGVV